MKKSAGMKVPGYWQQARLNPGIVSITEVFFSTGTVNLSINSFPSAGVDDERVQTGDM